MSAWFGATIEVVDDHDWPAPEIKGGNPMYNQAEQQQSSRVAPSARGTFTAFGARHVKGVALSRWIAAACFVIAGASLMAFGYWLGAVFFLAAGLNGLLAYLVPRRNLLRDAPDNATLSA